MNEFIFEMDARKMSLSLVLLNHLISETYARIKDPYPNLVLILSPSQDADLRNELCRMTPQQLLAKEPLGEVNPLMRVGSIQVKCDALNEEIRIETKVGVSRIKNLTPIFDFK